MNYNKIDKDFKELEKHTNNLINQYNKSCDSIKAQEIAIEKISQELDNAKFKAQELQKAYDSGNNTDWKTAQNLDNQNVIVNNLTKKLNLANSKLDETKNKANELKDEIKNSFNDRQVIKYGKSVDGIGTKIDKFKKRVTSLMASAMIFNLFSSQLTNLRNKFVSLLNTNDAFKSSLNQIKANLMMAFAPIYNSCLPAINSLMNALSKITGTIAIFVSSLFGKSLSDAKKEAQGLSKALDKTKKSGDKASGSLSSIDKLEVIQDSSSKSSGSNDDSIDYSGQIQYSQKLLDILNKIKAFLTPVFNFFKELYDKHGVIGIIEGVAIAFVGWKILKKVIGWISGLGSASKGAKTDFTGLLDGLGKAATAFAVLGGLSMVIDSITKLIDSFSNSGMSLGQVAGLLGIVLGEVAIAFIVLLAAMSKFEPSLQSIAGAVVIFAGLALALESVSRLIDTFSKSGMSLNEVIGLMATILVTIVTLMGSVATLGPVMTAGLGPFLGVVAGISALLVVMAATLPTILDAVGGFIATTAPSLVEILQTIGNILIGLIFTLGTTLPPIITSVGNLFTSVFNGVSKVISTIGNTLIGILQALGNLVASVLGSILRFINELGPATNNFVDNIIRVVTKLINFLISGIEYMVNTLVIGGVNKIINGINSISKYVGFKIPVVPDLVIPRFMPRLANGAVIPPRQEFAAILGDQRHGTNIETPAKLMADIFDERLARFFERFNSFTNEVKEIVFRNLTIVAQFGTRDFKKLVIDAVRLSEKELGRPLFVS